METALTILNDRARLRLNEGACLPLRSDFGRCRACASACPAQVLAVSVERVALADGCLHCGRCVAACPTEALQLDGFDIPADLPARRQPLEVECAKVPASALSSASITVACLGALSTGRIAALHQAAGERGVALIDRGWCGRCSAGRRAEGQGDEHPAAQALSRAVLWLETVADPRPAPALVARPLPAAQMPPAIPLPPAPVDEGPVLSRRQFFRQVAADPVGQRRNATPMGGNGRAAFPAAARRESPERRRLLDAIDAAAARAGSTLPAEFLPRVTASDACADHRICTAACPTGALKVVDAVDGGRLTFAATACIACDACARSCPEGALAVAEHGGERAAAVLATHVQRACDGCGDLFSPRGGETLCLACGKSRGFIGDAMKQLFGAPH